MQATKVEDGIPAPEVRENTGWVYRVSEEMKAMQPGQSVVVELRMARTLRAFGRYHGWTTVQKKEAGENGTALVRVWRVS